MNKFNKPTNPPAFPNESNAGNIWNDKGMTLRDYFAAKAMQFLLGYEESNFENDAEVAYKMADAMLKAREV